MSASSIFALFNFDSKLIVEGAPFVFPPNQDKSVPTIWVGRAHKSNAGYQAEHGRQVEKFRAVLNKGTMTTEQWEVVGRETLVESLITKWENVQDDKGNNIEFTKENVRTLLTQLPELADALSTFSSNNDNYLASNAEEDAGN